LNAAKAGAAFFKGAPAEILRIRREGVMPAISLSDHPRHTDLLRLRDGKTLIVRFVGADEGEALQGYFRQLSARSRRASCRPASSTISSTSAKITGSA
jgi:hypothetical protein